MASPLRSGTIEPGQLPRSPLGPLVLAVFMRALPLTMLGPLLPGIAASLGAGLAQIGWMVAAYATGSLLAQPVMGALSDVRGRRFTLSWCIAAFAAGSAICALSTSLVVLTAGRVIAALGAGGIAPVAAAFVGDAYPHERRGGALGALYGAFGLGTMAGAVLGGAMLAVARSLRTLSATPPAVAHDLSAFPWHLVFWVNVAVAGAALLAVRRLPPSAANARTVRFRTDMLGIGLLVAFAASLMSAATGKEPWPVISCIAGALSIGGLFWWEPRARAPLFDPAAFAGRGQRLIYSIAAAFGVPSFSLTIYSATYCVARFHESEAQAGIALFALACAYVGGAVGGGRAANAFGPKAPLLAGLAAAAIGLACLALSPTPMLAAAAMALGGAGLGFASAPPNALILQYAGERTAGVSTGVATMFATSGSITAPALVSAFIRFGGADPSAALRSEMMLASAIAAACGAAAAFLPVGIPRR